jgi:hypothetical protein
LIGEHKVCRVIALHQIPDEQMLGWSRFCPACGSSITDEPSNQPGLMLINGGTLDDPTSMIPTTEMYCEYALTGAHFDGTQRFTKMPIEWYSQRLIG